MDTAKLFYGDDPDYEIWLDEVLSRIDRTREEAARREAAASK